MSDLGIMVYGYTKEQAGLIKAAFDTALLSDVIVVAASGANDRTIMSILEQGPNESYAEAPETLLMFINFDDSAIRKCLAVFPKPENLQRPLFCVLTENNAVWTLGTLLEHLREEHKRFHQEKT